MTKTASTGAGSLGYNEEASSWLTGEYTSEWCIYWLDFGSKSNNWSSGKDIMWVSLYPRQSTALPVA